MQCKLKFAAVKAFGLAGLSTFAMTSGLTLPSPATAAAAAANAPEEIIVTARKREESIMKTPVIIQAISQKQIQDMNLTSVISIASATPGLQMFDNTAGTGITVNMRGLGNGVSAKFIDQSVALNIDGFTTSTGSLFRQGMFDAAQVEVMKGPQALFYGKSTSAGLIAIHSADPTSEWDTKVTVGYEFKADEMNLDGYVSGPLTDTLGIRIAGYHSTMKGYLYNPNPANPGRRLPNRADDGARLTLKYDDPDQGLRVNFKAAISNNDSKNWYGELNQAVCPGPTNPVPFFNQYDDCKINQTTSGQPGMLPYLPGVSFGAFNRTAFTTGNPSPLFKNGQPYSHTRTGLGILSVDYDITPGLTLSSLTGLSWVNAADAGPSATAGIGFLNFGSRGNHHDFSQELRLTSDWKDSWINFMAGGLYSRGTRRDQLVLSIPTAGTIPGLGPFGLYTDTVTRLKTETDSAFGQILLTPIDKFELSAGLRYTKVYKFFNYLYSENNYPTFFNPGPGGETAGNIPLAARSFSEDATVPEFTLTYRPNDDITAFVSYKKGYKGPGFNLSSTATTFTAASISSFGGERAKGVEGGIKAQMMDRQLALSATGYLYDYTGLQVTFTDLASLQARISNGANARVQGFELNANYAPDSVPGLTVGAFVNYNDTHYSSFPTAPCWSGQTLAQGCQTIGAARFQNLGGQTVHFAPKWVGTLSAAYKWDLNDKYTVSFDARGQYSSGYLTSPELNPIGQRNGYMLVDLAAHLTRSDGSWDLAVMCRDCTNNIYVVNGADAGNGGGVTMNIGRPLQIMLQLTVRPNLL